MRLSEVSTPALCVDLDVFERNIDRMHSFFASVPCNLRPHFKANKTPAIAHRQARAGCAGFTTATLGEAELLADEGFDDILIANEICDTTKMKRLAALAARIPLIVAVDSAESVELIRGTGVRVVVDVNVGMPRCGVSPEEAGPLADLARGRGLAVRGVMGYEGHAVLVPDRAERTKLTADAMASLVRAHDAVGGDVVSSGGTGTYDINDAATEIQAGSYALMDTAYAELDLPFEYALAVVATVIHANAKWTVADCGLKALGMDHGNPAIAGARVLFCSDEHVTFTPGTPLAVGERVLVRPAHVDPTIAYHDAMHLADGPHLDADVVDRWAVDLRGWNDPGIASRP